MDTNWVSNTTNALSRLPLLCRCSLRQSLDILNRLHLVIYSFLRFLSHFHMTVFVIRFGQLLVRASKLDTIRYGTENVLDIVKISIANQESSILLDWNTFSDGAAASKLH